MSRLKKYIFVGVIGLVVIFVLSFSLAGKIPSRNDLVSQPTNQPTNSLITTPTPATSTIIFVGDMMFDRYVAKKINEAQDPLLPFAKIKDFLDTADFLVGNLEGPISARGKNQGSAYSFRFEPVGTINALKYAGFDLVNLANNHIYDYGLTAAKDTIDYLADSGISYVGFGKNSTEANSPVIKKVGDANIAFLGYTEFYGSSARAGENTAGLSTWERQKIISEIKKARANPNIDLVVVNLHWGVEYKTSSSAFQKEMAHQLVDAGADLIVGHHPHVVQEVEKYSRTCERTNHANEESCGEVWAAYSLGNFIFDQNFSADTKKGLALKVDLVGKKIDSVQGLWVRFNSVYQPYLEEVSK